MRIEKVFHTKKETELTAEQLAAWIHTHQGWAVHYQMLQDLYIGEHPILSAPNKAPYKPDNRLVVNQARYIVDTVNGFFTGIPIRTSSEKEAVNQYIQQFERYNDIDDHHARLSKLCSIYGHAYELLFLDEQAQIGAASLPPLSAFLVYDESIRERALYAVRYQKNADHTLTGSVSTKDRIRYFTLGVGGLVFHPEEEENAFGEIPMIEYRENDERIGAFEPVVTLINAYNKALSEKCNDVDYFADAYMKILGAVLSEKDLQQIRDHRIINLASPDTDKLVVEFMEKPNADQTQENLLNRLEKLIFQVAMTANISDEHFGTSSGISLKYKLQSMSNLANTKERKFTSGMNRRYYLISRVPNTPIAFEDLVGIQYRFTRNTPANVQDEAETAQKLQGMISEETLLETLSIIPDAKQELERMRAEEAAEEPQRFDGEGDGF